MTALARARPVWRNSALQSHRCGSLARGGRSASQQFPRRPSRGPCRGQQAFSMPPDHGSPDRSLSRLRYSHSREHRRDPANHVADAMSPARRHRRNTECLMELGAGTETAFDVPGFFGRVRRVDVGLVRPQHQVRGVRELRQHSRTADDDELGFAGYVGRCPDDVFKRGALHVVRSEESDDAPPRSTPRRKDDSVATRRPAAPSAA